MLKLQLVLFAILFFLCAAVYAQGGVPDASTEVADLKDFDGAKDEAARWRWHDDENSAREKETEQEEKAEAEVEEPTQVEKRATYFPPCQPPRGSSSASSSASSGKTSSSSSSASSGKTSSSSSSSGKTSSSSSSGKSSSSSSSGKSSSSSSSGKTSSTTGTKSSTSTATTGTKSSTSTATTGTKSSTSTATTGSKSATSTSTGKTSTSSSSSSGGSNVGLCDVVPASQEPLKLLVPLYVYPGSAWDQLVSAASKVDIIAIVNPNSGPTSSPDSSYTNYMNKLKNAGVEMIGYVYTSYGDRALSAVKADIDTYASRWPLLTGIFFDEVSNSASDLAFYTELNNYIKSKGYVHNILNPGVQPAQGYLDISTSIVIFENYGTSVNSASYSSWVKCAPNASQKSGYKYKFAGIAHTASSSNAASFISNFHSKGMGLVYVTDGAGGCCTYNNLVSYFASEATTIQSLNA